MRARYPLAGLLMLLCASAVTASKSTDETDSSLLPLEARNADLSAEEDVISSSYVLPNQIFNDGKPYYARQDPVSGQLDFTAKKPAGIEPEYNEVLQSKDKIVLNRGSSPNIHDFLNLPVKYSSSKFVYPLVSSSYANLKYQGSNKNYVTNKKPTSVVAPVTVTVTPPRYSPSEYNFPTTKLTAVTPTEAGYYTTSTTRETTASPTTRTTTRTTPSTTVSTTTVRYTTTTRRPLPSPTSTTTSVPPRLITTRKKFVPLRKTTPNTITTSSSTTVRLPAAPPSRPTLSSSDVKFTTHHPTPQAAIFPTDPTTTTKVYTSTSSAPIVFTTPSTTTTTRPLPVITDATQLPNLDPADVYSKKAQQQVEQQKVEQLEQERVELKPPTKQPMTLSEIFNSLAEEEVNVANNYQQNQGFDAQGNLIEPIAPSQPSPFAMQPQYPVRPPGPQQELPQQGQQQPQLISGSLENFGNEYVSYQVQQPNMMQYRPMPGQINNVVISPGQQSASFVLGSQQQVGQMGQMGHVGHAGHVEKEPLFSKETGGQVQYGQVINEDIGSIKRPLYPHGPQAPAAQPQPTPPSTQQQMPNLQGNQFQGVGTVSGAGVATNVGSNAGANAGPAPGHPGGNYPEAPPEAPTPYQQLPLIGKVRPTKKQPTKSQDTVPSASISKPATLNQPQDTKELLVSTNIRFPANDEESNEEPTKGMQPVPPVGPSINGHAQPLSLQQIQQANPVVFPKISDEETVQIQQHEVLNINQQPPQLTFPVQGQGQGQPQTQPEPTPSQDMQPPPQYPPQPQPGPGKRPLHHYKEFDRKAQSAQASGPRPNPNLNLPNILPQFRPNAKISNGHHQSLKQEPGNIRLNQQGLKMPYNPSTPPQFAHRRQPLQQQQLPKRYPMNRISEYGPANPAMDVNRRIYRLPPNAGQRMTPQLRDRLYARRPNLPGLPNIANGPPRAVDGYPAERHAPHAEPYKLNPGDLEDFEEEDLVINDPPQAPNKERQTPSESKLEAVVTLQMLQSQKKPSQNSDDTGAGEIQVTADNDPQEDSYPGYPKEEATPSDTTEYQNTPFSVIRDQPQEPILKNKKPQSLQQQTKGQQQLPKQKFPYAIEKPDPSFTELQPQAGQVPGVLIAPRIINSAFSSGTEAPIAIAYTPTEPSQLRGNPHPSLYHADTQTEQVLSNDFDLRGHNYEKDFMAPFYPSASLGAAAATGNVTPSNWKIVSSASDPSVFEKNSINRADVGEPPVEEPKKPMIVETSTSTEKNFELDGFQPQLQGGFKPIYPPNYVHVEGKVDSSPESGEDSKKPLAMALTGAQSTPAQIISTGVIMSSSSSSSSGASDNPTTKTTKTTSTTTSPSTTTTTTTLPEITTTKAVELKASNPTKKSNFETSLAALLFGEDDEEYEDGARKSELVKTVAEKAPSGPRNVARMGPRSLRS